GPRAGPPAWRVRVPAEWHVREVRRMSIRDHREPRRPAVGTSLPAVRSTNQDPDYALPAARRPSTRAAFSLRINGRTSGLMVKVSKSLSHRSGVSNGKSEPKSTFSRRSVLAYVTSCRGKYFGDHPDRSM